MSNPDGTATFDIEFIDDSLDEVTFGHNILQTERDTLFVDGSQGELGLTPFVSLAPEFFFNPVGITARFRSPFANTQVIPNLDVNNCPTTPANDGCHFVSDAELELFTRDPSELYNTLLGDPPTGLDFLKDMSTPRIFPTGEHTSLLNPSPFAVPDVVVTDVAGPPERVLLFCKGNQCIFKQINQPELNPVVSTSFWLADNTADPNNLISPVATNLWGAPANQPSGLGSIKAARLVQHAPCEFEVALQPQLNTLKEQVVNSLNLCGQSFSFGPLSATVDQVTFKSFDAIPAITRIPSPSGFGAFQTEFGILLHGDVVFDAKAPIATAPCDVQFLYEYRLTIVNGVIQVGYIPHYFNAVGGGIGDINSIFNLCNYAARELIGDSNGNGLEGNPPLLTNVAVSQIRNLIQTAQFLDTGPISLALGLVGSQVKCHSVSVGGGSFGGSCVGVAKALESAVHAGAARLGVTLDATESATIHNTLNFGASSPDGSENWSCQPASAGITADDCTLKLPVDGLIGQPDVLDIQPFESLTEFDNPSLLLFYFLANFDSPTFPVSNICNRQPVSSSGPSYERVYATVNVRDLTCGDHDPALMIETCSKDSDCGGQASVCVNGNCDVPFTTACATNAQCMPWEQCVQRTGKKRCIAIGNCGTGDPFASGQCPNIFDQGTPEATFCFGGQCRRE